MDTEVEQPSSLVFVQASELFPKKALESGDDSIQVPFPELAGEHLVYLGQTSDAILAISNFRLFIRFKESFVNIPLRLMESLDVKDPSFMDINCKDARSFRILFDTSEQCDNFFQKLSQRISPISCLEDLFAFPFYAWCMDGKESNPNSGEDAECVFFRPRGSEQYSFMSEVRRMGFDNLQNAWRITDINSNFELCSTYPKLHVVPAKISDSDMEAVVKFRTSGRFPSVVWRHMINGAVIARSSQPIVGWLGWRSPEDEALLHAIGTSCAVDSASASLKKRMLREVSQKTNGNFHSDAIPNGGVVHGSEMCVDNDNITSSENGEVEPRKVLIVDARAYSAAVVNRAKGGGCECEEYYPGCEVLFMNLANIHTIRKSFQSLRTLCSGPRDATNWWSSLEKTNWLHHISLLLNATNTVANAIHNDRRPVVVHCSDGWDRTTQIVSLAELMLDPYYRTIEGFQVLVGREWLEFGHRFADRCGHGPNLDDNQRCPVFLQWLDCVHQLTRQFPCSFEFNETFLVKLAQHAYSCLFGTFLCNSENERLTAKIPKCTFSVWSLFKMNKREYLNFLYSSSSEQVLQASCQPRSLQLWSAVYLAYPTPYSETPLVENGDTSDYGDSVSSACITPVSPTFPNGGIDQEEAGRFCHITESKSDGNLFCKNCLKNGLEPDESSEHVFSLDKNLKSRSCPECRTDFSENAALDSGSETVVSESTSLYRSAQSDSNAVGILSCDDNEVESMSSSSATVILDPSEGEPNVESKHSPSEKLSITTLTKETNETERSEEELRVEEDCNEQSVTCEPSFEEEQTECSDRNSEEILTKSASVSTLTGPVQEISSSTATLRASSSELFTRYLDVDGLTYVSDPVQKRLRQIEMAYQAKVESLQRQLIDAQRRRTLSSENKGASGITSDLADEVCSLSESSVNGEQPPLSLSSADEGSWTQVEDYEAQPTLWVPDHAATNCAKCDTQFWIANRKHHCRNCGLVFCGTCSEKRLPVPEEQLYDPVRVCIACFEKLVTLQERENDRTENKATTLN
ncbi:myotubularin-related protein 4-like [Acropora millepora]|uniref:myotubularin-related protein 4-like n=1 Tax=Acropora millepora TaxID=45264 RepID=UPI001CF3A716|nr:myotubularin-related protein 4-like [Acropora millepora]